MNSYSVIASPNPNNNNNKKKVVFIMGATGTGKTNNKATEAERHGVPHYLLGFLEDPEKDFTVQEFCHHALMAINQIIANGHIPIVVGCSNTYIEEFIEDPRIKFRAKFNCCFVWMDVSLPVLYKNVGKRIDKMVDMGLVEEHREMFVLEKEVVDYTRGIRRVIGAQEMDSYFRVEDKIEDEGIKKLLLNAAIQEMKDNTCKLVNTQLRKIQRLRNQLGWEMHRIDATSVFEERYKKLEVEDAWKKKVLMPSLGIVSDFLKKN
ncbi:hypothetical protein QYF36_001712 [Acer negundo]|nr:hypothetical protein QYF36_001712 [Acer negundo]